MHLERPQSDSQQEVFRNVSKIGPEGWMLRKGLKQGRDGDRRTHSEVQAEMSDLLLVSQMKKLRRRER